MPSVSILLPTYNRAYRLDGCIEAVLCQTWDDWELVICDDASQDSTPDIASSWAERDVRIRHIRNNENLGLPASRNVAVSSAKAALVFFIEDDIILEQDCVEKLVRGFTELASSSRVGAVAPSKPDELEHPLEVPSRNILDFTWRSSNKDMQKPCMISMLTGLIRYNFMPHFNQIQEVPSVHACSLYLKKAILSIGGYDEQTYGGNFLYEEADLNIRLAQAGYRFFFIPKAVAWHRIAGAGGCRVDLTRYAYYFVLNHFKFVIKNFRLRSIYMTPCFLLSTAVIAAKAVFTRGLLGLGRHRNS